MDHRTSSVRPEINSTLINKFTTIPNSDKSIKITLKMQKRLLQKFKMYKSDVIPQILIKLCVAL